MCDIVKVTNPYPNARIGKLNAFLSMGIGRKRSEISVNNRGIIQSMREALSLGDPVNESNITEGGAGGIQGEKEPLLSLDMSDEKLLSLIKQWQTDYEEYFNKEVKTRAEDNRKYYLGNQYGSLNAEYPNTNNVIFESTETLLPIICRENPEPTVNAFGGDEQQRFATLTAKVIEEIVDRQSLKLKVKQATRHWMVDLLGVMKLSWSMVEDEMEITTVMPKSIILDPHGTFDGGRFMGKYIGEEKVESAEKLMERFPEQADYIEEDVQGKLGTTLKYHEWWTDTYVCWSYKKVILGKARNPHWDEGGEQEGMDEFGQPRMTPIAPMNHFRSPRMPYSFIWVYSLGEYPHDCTSLIEQSRSLQDSVNKRSRQIDKNADEANNSWVFNNQFSQEEAARALRAMRKGGGIIAPTDNIGTAVQRLDAPALPAFVFNDLLDSREQISNMFGVRGSTASSLMEEKTVRGKIEIRGTDFDRSSVIVEQLEQCMDYLFNYMVQMIYIYYSAEELAAVLGPELAMEYMQLKPMASRLMISVKEGSMIPQSPLTQANQAVDLATAGLLDPETMFERLDFPNPQEATQRLIQYQLNPGALLQQVPVDPNVMPVEAPVAEVPPVMPPPVPAMAEQPLVPFNV